MCCHYDKSEYYDSKNDSTENHCLWYWKTLYHSCGKIYNFYQYEGVCQCKEKLHKCETRNVKRHHFCAFVKSFIHTIFCFCIHQIPVSWVTKCPPIYFWIEHIYKRQTNSKPCKNVIQ